MARTVGELAALAGITVRTLHHYDEIGLVRPSARSDAGYRLYDDADLERLQTVLFYRELGLPLDRIASILDDAEFDRGLALLEQRELLVAERSRVEQLLKAVDTAIDAYERGITMSDETMFEVFGEDQRELQTEAEQRWGDTDAWAQSRRRTAGYTKPDWEAVKAEMGALTEEVAEAFRSGAPPESPAAMDAVEAHRRHISERFYDCPPEMHVALGDMYVTDGRFTAFYDAIEPGLAVYVRDAIHANAARLAG